MSFDPESVFFHTMPHECVLLTSSKAMYCMLCERVVQVGAWLHHTKEESHQSRRAALKAVTMAEQLLHARRKEASSWTSRIGSFSFVAWQDELYQKVFNFVTDGSKDSNSVTLPLEKFEFLERVALIRLAVWKVTCLLSPPPIAVGPFRNVMDCQAWIQSGWKVLKNHKRDSTAIGIVLAQVIPFLDQSELAVPATLQVWDPMITPIEHDLPVSSNQEAETAFFNRSHGFGDVQPLLLSCINCILCQKESPLDQWSGHIEEPCHMSKFNAVEKVRAAERILYHRRLEALSWKSRINTLHTSYRQNKLFRNMLHYITDCSSDGAAINESLGRCEAMEQVVMIKLAVWKTTCIVSAPLTIKFTTVFGLQQLDVVGMENSQGGDARLELDHTHTESCFFVIRLRYFLAQSRE
jgi:hypothetical protein